ncbi:MAG: MOSC domain-containing protein [Fidelibacterota bacterium]
MKKPRVISINTSGEKGTRKNPILRVNVIENWGIAGDAHAGEGERQISLLSVESIEKIRERGLNTGPGAFAENITTQGIDLLSIKIGERLKIGEKVVIEVAQIGKECHSRCSIYLQAGECVMPGEGIFARVLRGGEIRAGDEISILK